MSDLLDSVLSGLPASVDPLSGVLVGDAPGMTRSAVPSVAYLTPGVGAIPVPGAAGLSASQETLPTRGAYAGTTVAGRLFDLQSRKAEATDLEPPIDLTLLFENAAT